MSDDDKASPVEGVVRCADCGKYLFSMPPGYRLSKPAYCGSHAPGDPPPAGYVNWHEWAEIQIEAGLKAKRCDKCGLWKFPQDRCKHKQKS